MHQDSVIYKIALASEWEEMTRAGHYSGSEVDRTDGFIHFSTRSQVKETASRHFAGQADLLLIAVECSALDDNSLKWEKSRGGDLFPHLYCPLKRDAVLWSIPLPLATDGFHIFPPELAK